MLTRRALVLLMCAAGAACSTSSMLARRSLADGVTRTFPANYARVSGAVDQAMEQLPVNIVAPTDNGSRRIVHFNRPVTDNGWGESGRVVITRVDAETTRVTVAVSSRDILQPDERSEEGYAGAIFRVVQARLIASGIE